LRDFLRRHGTNSDDVFGGRIVMFAKVRLDALSDGIFTVAMRC
jgi:hypothetical protein